MSKGPTEVGRLRAPGTHQGALAGHGALRLDRRCRRRHHDGRRPRPCACVTISFNLAAATSTLPETTPSPRAIFSQSERSSGLTAAQRWTAFASRWRIVLAAFVQAMMAGLVERGAWAPRQARGASSCDCRSGRTARCFWYSASALPAAAANSGAAIRMRRRRRDSGRGVWWGSTGDLLFWGGGGGSADLRLQGAVDDAHRVADLHRRRAVVGDGLARCRRSGGR